MKRLVLYVSVVLSCLSIPCYAQNSIYGLVSDGEFAKYDLDAEAKTVLRNDVFVSSDNRSTYDPIHQRFFSNTNDNLLVIDLVTNTKGSYGDVFGRNVSIEYDPEWNCVFGLVSDGVFAKYDLETRTKTVLRMDMFVSSDNRSTYDSINHRFFSNTYDNVYMIDLVTGVKNSLGNIFGRNVSIEYDPEWNCLFGLVSDGTFAKYDLATMSKTVLRTDVFVSSDNRSTYDPLNHIFYVNTYDSLITLDIQAGTKEAVYNLFGRNVSIEHTVPEPATLAILALGGVFLRKRKIA